METNGENPLLDSRFPDVSGKGRGYQLEACNDGTTDWSELRKVSIWQTLGALEQEFRDKAAQFAQAKRSVDVENEDDALKQSSDNKCDEKFASNFSAADVKSTEADDTMAEVDVKITPLTPDSKTTEKPSPTNTVINDPISLRPRQALPHHLPKLDSLSHKLDDIRKNMGDSVSYHELS